MRRAERRRWTPAIDRAKTQQRIPAGAVVPPPPSPPWQYWWDERGAPPRWVRHDPRVIAYVEVLVNCPDPGYVADLAARVDTAPDSVVVQEHDRSG